MYGPTITVVGQLTIGSYREYAFAIDGEAGDSLT